MSFSLVSGKSTLLHDGYIAAIENCCAPKIDKCTVFTTHVASLLLDTSFNTIFTMHTKLYLQNFIIEPLYI